MAETHTKTSGATAADYERRSKLLWTAAILLFIAVSGLGMQMRGALIPQLSRQWGVSDSMLGLIGPAGTLGYAVTVLATGAFGGRLDTRKVILGGLVVTTLAFVGMGAAPVFVGFLGFLIIRGMGTGAVRALDRPVLGHLYPESRGRLFNLYDLAWAVGAAAGPAVMGFAIASGNWRLAYYGLALAFVVIIAFIWLLDTPADGAEAEMDLAAAGRLLKTPAIAAMAVALTFHTGLEGAMFLWLPTFGERIAGFEATTASLLLSAYMLAYIPGRIVYTGVAERVGYVRLVLVLEALLIPTFYVTFFVAEGVAVFAGAAVLGALVSGVFPTLLAFGTDAAPEYSAPINAIALGTASVAMAAVPWLVGALTQLYDIRVAMWLPLALTLVVGPTVIFAWRAQR